MTPYPKALEAFPALSQSRLATFDRCALSAKFDNEYRRGWDSHPQGRGRLFHHFAAECLRAMYDQNEATIPTDLAVEIMQETLRQSKVDTTCSECGDPIVRREGLQVVCEHGHAHHADFTNVPMSEIKDLRWIAVKWANDNAFDIENLVDIEQGLQATVRYPDSAGGWVERVLRGQLDVLFVAGEEDEEAIVLDWKDTWDLPAPTEVGFDGYFQQRFYAFLVLKNYEQIQRVTLREFYVRYSEPREVSVHRAALEDIEAELAALAERYDRAFEQEAFPPSPGRHCGFCPRPGACPIFPGVRHEGEITSQEQALRVAREATVAKAALDQRQKALKAWAGSHGPIPISSHKGPRQWGHRARKRIDRPTKEKMQEALGAAGVDEVNLDELYRESKSTRFEQFAPGPDDPDATNTDLTDALERSIDEASKGEDKAA